MLLISTHCPVNYAIDLFLLTQVIDGFKVKQTKSTKETVAFLTVFTRYLQSAFRVSTFD